MSSMEGEGGDEPGPSQAPDTGLRRRMLDAAQELVEEARGLTVSLEHLSFEEIIKRAGASRSSVYRLWPRKEDFYIDLICELAGPSWQGTSAFDQGTITVAGTVVAERLDMLQTPEGRRCVMREAVRQGARQNFQAIVTSTQWRTYVALTATILSMPDNEVRQRVKAALQNAEREFIRRMVLFYEDMAVILGLRLRPPFESFVSLAAAGAAVVEGLGLRQLIMPEAVNQTFFLPGTNGPEEWTMPALGFLAIIEMYVEIDPDYSYEEALPEYLKRLSGRPSGDAG